ncbi:hypothetical protein Y032_0024g894 [Ancylostoma ceylanicum]|uniref:Uncharacterized protein n=1 Tax=Ancylostoma ceylanicum TaxID=53326 RepID=A0A016UWZ0_9BILA|nr:hypothetical protein Y032_0024g894 [Ancylostoma ceylanicum]
MLEIRNTGILAELPCGTTMPSNQLTHVKGTPAARSVVEVVIAEVTKNQQRRKRVKRSVDSQARSERGETNKKCKKEACRTRLLGKTKTDEC